MTEAVALLCAATAATCTVLLVRAWLASRLRLLVWSALCFALLTVNNVLLLLDLTALRDVDLAIPRTATGLAGLLILLYGLIYDRQPGARG